jgi:hypothetical protein
MLPIEQIREFLYTLEVYFLYWIMGLPLLGLWVLGRALWKGHAFDVCLLVMSGVFVATPFIGSQAAGLVYMLTVPVWIAAVLAWIWRWVSGINSNLTELVEAAKVLAEEKKKTTE